MSHTPSLSTVSRQKEIEVEIQVIGISDWKDCLPETVALGPAWAKLCGGTTIPLMTYLQKEAEVNGVSVERCIMNHFLNQRYILEELVVEFDSDQKREWGKAVWYKDHPSYNTPAPAMQSLFEQTNLPPNCWYALFKTEHAGDQRFCLYSTQMATSTGILLHKTLVYHRAVFSPPSA